MQSPRFAWFAQPVQSIERDAARAFQGLLRP